jgi:hypothetical protein
MYAKLLICLLLVAILPSCGNSQNKNVVEKKDRQIQRLKDAAFCECLRVCLPKNDSLLIKDGSTAGYFETSKFGEDVTSRVDSLARKGGSVVYKSWNGSPLCIMKCLDFYNSPPLDSLIQVISRENKPDSK